MEEVSGVRARSKPRVSLGQCSSCALAVPFSSRKEGQQIQGRKGLVQGRKGRRCRWGEEDLCLKRKGARQKSGWKVREEACLKLGEESRQSD